MANCELSESGSVKVELVFNILLYSDITMHIWELSRDIQEHSETVYVTLVYSKPWYIQNLDIF